MSEEREIHPKERLLWEWVCYIEGVGEKPRLKYNRIANVVYGTAKKVQGSRSYRWGKKI